MSSSYWPPIHYLYMLYSKPSTLIEVFENYQKKSIRNKCHVITSNGLKTLSVPLLKGKHNRVPLKEVKIAYHEEWQINHINTLTSAYSNAPYYSYYHQDIIGLINEKQTYLYDLNQTLMEWIRATFLHHQLKEIKTTETFKGVNKQDFEMPYPYGQVYEKKSGFLGKNVSILDLIFNVGYEIPLYFDNWINFEAQSKSF